MNLALFQNENILSQSDERIRVCLKNRQHEHIVKIQKLGPGREIQIGLLNGNMGRGLIVEQDQDSTTIEVSLSSEPPAANPIKLILALPRPLMLKRVLQSAVSMGVKEIHLIHSNKVEKSYWQSPQISDEEIFQQALLGLEQGVDTVLPKISKHLRFRPFVEDQLPELIENHKAYVAHPSANAKSAKACQQDCYLAVGPEGGFTDYEVEKFEQAGMQTLSLGPRILRVETAVPVLLAKLAN
ncbi:16S rRNA (uracil(1498)-N(3))-methyltransferase [uncultured Pseudoteredinibacter sp.]|uniref:16S rRNA (uracil(1498)-N(3))-methyltransferase n=1 Tax=uncultured Pseudoteredinibacter sp. TaxID=1641701 RepID=UPI0026030C79|nr:16S rRNA (uracil(1498)-N(3))-methyltransferase [uncultured Pseudoteredinibacter sp.]